MNAEYSRVGSLPDVVAEHVLESAFLWEGRARRVSGVDPQYRLGEIVEHDARLSAHLRGLTMADDGAVPHVRRALEEPTPGMVFTSTVFSLLTRRLDLLDHLVASFGSSQALRDGVVSAYGWVEPDRLHGLIPSLLQSPDEVRRLLGLATCAVHRVDPLASGPWIRDEAAPIRARAMRLAAELGREELGPTCARAIADEDPACRFWAAWSATLMGNRGVAVQALAEEAMAQSPERVRALTLTLQTMSVRAAHDVLQSLARDPKDLRSLIQGSGIVGDPAYVPWLIGHTSDDRTARLAGEAFSLITGTDLAWLDLEHRPPETFESGPNDDPDDPNVEMDPDEGLPWPDPDKVKDWWAKNSNRFTPGQRYFMGAPVTREHCIDILKNGYQRQRILAAHYLCLLEPGTPLFNTSAPAWRQQRLLAEMR